MMSKVDLSDTWHLLSERIPWDSLHRYIVELRGSRIRYGCSATTSAQLLLGMPILSFLSGSINERYHNQLQGSVRKRAFDL